MKTFSGFVMLAGVLLLLTDDKLFSPLRDFALYFVGGGLLLLILTQLLVNRGKNWRCRLGFHDFERKERVAEMPAMRWYRCRRCSKEKRAASIA